MMVAIGYSILFALLILWGIKEVYKPKKTAQRWIGTMPRADGLQFFYVHDADTRCHSFGENIENNLRGLYDHL